MDQYIIGEPDVPYWCKNRIMLYRRADGSTGYEFHGSKRILRLRVGDILLRDSKQKIIVKKKG